MQGEKVAKFEKVDFLEKFQKKNFSRSIVERIRLGSACADLSDLTTRLRKE